MNESGRVLKAPKVDRCCWVCHLCPVVFCYRHRIDLHAVPPHVRVIQEVVLPDSFRIELLKLLPFPLPLLMSLSLLEPKTLIPFSNMHNLDYHCERLLSFATRILSNSPLLSPAIPCYLLLSPAIPRYPPPAFPLPLILESSSIFAQRA